MHGDTLARSKLQACLMDKIRYRKTTHETVYLVGVISSAGEQVGGEIMLTFLFVDLSMESELILKGRAEQNN